MQPARIWNRNFSCVFAAYFLISFSNMCVNTLSAVYAKSLGAGPVLIGMLTGLFYGVAIAVRPAIGPLVAKVDSRRLMFLVSALSLAVNLGYAFSGSIAVFTAFRVLNGVMQGLMGSLFFAIASDSLPIKKLGAGMGIYGLSFVLGQALGPALGTALRSYALTISDEALGFHLAFFASALCSVLTLIPAIIIRPPKKTAETKKSAGAWYANIISVRALPAALMLTLAAMAYNLYTAYIVPYGEALNLQNVGIFFTVAAVTGLCVRPLYGKLNDRIGINKTLYPGYLFIAVSLIIVSRANTLPILLVGAVTGAMGFSAALPGLQTMAILSDKPQRRAAVSNTIICGQDLGFFLCPILGGIIYAHSDYKTMYLSAVAPCVLAAVILIVIWPIHKRWRAEGAALLNTEKNPAD